MAVVLLPMSLTACVTSGSSGQNVLAPIPGDIPVCINKLVPQPEKIQTKADVAALIAEFRKNDVAKTYCGRRLIQLYESQR